MNEQVKELIKQAGLNIDGFGDPIWGGLCAADKTKFLEKYTELIVKECTETLKAVAVAYEGSETDADYASGVNDSIDILKNHFGVAE